MNKLVLCLFLIFGVCECFKLNVNPLYPKGIRGCVRNINGLEKFEFRWYVKSHSKSGYEDDEERPEVKQNRGVADESSNGLWCVLNEVAHLRANDELVYYGIIHKNGSIEYSKNYTKILQAGDFLDLSGVYILPPDPNDPSPCDSGKSNACVLERVNKIKSTTELTIKKLLTMKPISKIQNITLPASIQEMQSRATVVDSPIEITRSDKFNSESNSENPSLFRLHMFNKHLSTKRPTTSTLNKQSEDGKFLSGSSKSSPDVTLDSRKPVLISTSTLSTISLSSSTPHSKTSSNDGECRTTPEKSHDDNLNKKISKNITSLMENPINQNMNNTDAYQDSLMMFRNSNNSQACENSLKSAKIAINTLTIELSESSNLLKKSESTLEKMKSELNKYNILFRETFKIILSRSYVNQSNILILRFNEPVEDCEVKLHYIIQQHLNINPKVYDVVKSKPLDEKSIQFELQTYAQKLLIFLMNMTKKNYRYNFIDVDNQN